MRGRTIARAVVGLCLAVAVAVTPAGCAPDDRGDGEPPPSPPPPAATAADYAWTASDDRLAPGFCLSWVRGLSPEQVVRRLGGRTLPRAGTAGKGQAVIGVLRLPGWSLIAEVGGRPGATQDRAGVLSRATTVVSSCRDAAGEGRFLLASDGAVTVDFDPWMPTIRRGRDPDALYGAMREAGFAVPAEPGNPGGEDDLDSRGTEAAFALAERLTGIPLTRDQLRSADAVPAVFPDRRYPGPGATVPDREPRRRPPDPFVDQVS